MMRKSQSDNRKEYMLESSGRDGLRIGVRAQMLFRSVWMLLFIAVLAVVSYVSMHRMDDISASLNGMLQVNTDLGVSQRAIEGFFAFGDSALYEEASQGIDSAIALSDRSMSALALRGVADTIVNGVGEALHGLRRDYDTIWPLRHRVDEERAVSDSVLLELKGCLRAAVPMQMQLLMVDAETYYQQAVRTWTRKDFDSVLSVLNRMQQESSGAGQACRDLLKVYQTHCAELGRVSVLHVAYEMDVRNKVSQATEGLLVTAAAAKALSHGTAVRANVVLVGSVGVIALLSVLLIWLQAEVFSRSLLKVRGQLRGVAGGDLTYEEPGSEKVFNRLDEFGDVMKGLRSMQEGLKGMIVRVRESANQIDGASKSVYSHADELRQQAMVQAVQAEQSVNSMTVVSDKIHRNSDYAQESKRIALDNQKAMAAFSESAAASDAALQEIAHMMGVINGVAQQTNILALNAAVEAARAGESGRGFAVVAGEVRKLAERSGAAAQKVGELVDNAQRASERFTQEMQSVLPKIAESVELSEKVAAMGDDQLVEVQKIAKQVSLLSEQSQANSDMSYQLAEQSEALAKASADMLEVIGLFKG